jgi:5-methylthioadenosine/S-adenosylhomocysteine deaminase
MIRSFVSLLFLAALAFAEPADWVLTARWVVTMDSGRRVIENGAVAIRGERVAAVGTRAEILRRFEPRQRLDRPQAILLPGLVNTHAHAPMSLLRGIAGDLSLQDWLEKHIFPAEAKNVNPEFVRWGTRLACLEMALSGVTTYADMYYFEEIVAEVTQQAGLRGVLGETIINFPVPDARTPAEGLARAEEFLRRFEKDPLIVPAVAPHALYTNTEETLRASRALANKYNVPLLTHLSETRKENGDCRAKWGKSPAQVLDQWGVFAGKTLVAHAVWVDEADRKLLRERGVGVAHCPSSNMMLASGVAPVAAMLDAGLAVGLGTDGPAGSNNDFNLFEEMDLAAKLQKVSAGDPRALPARQALEMATILGARALSLDKETGSLEPGKRADLITVALDAPNGVPLFDVYSQLVYALKGSEVRDVMVNGRLIVRERQSLTLDRATILAKAEQMRAAVAASLRPR